jgi:hypothetical protein
MQKGGQLNAVDNSVDECWATKSQNKLMAQHCSHIRRTAQNRFKTKTYNYFGGRVLAQFSVPSKASSM